MADERVYRPDEPPDVEVPVDGVWRVGELRMWRQDDDGAWIGQVQYRPDEIRGSSRRSPRAPFGPRYQAR